MLFNMFWLRFRPCVYIGKDAQISIGLIRSGQSCRIRKTALRGRIVYNRYAKCYTADMACRSPIWYAIEVDGKKGLVSFSSDSDIDVNFII